MRATSKMSDGELIAIINTHRRDSLGADDSDLSGQRTEAMDRYYGRPFGDEEDGKSKVVSKDLSETVDWIMPPIMKSLVQGGDIVEFPPIDADDEAQAKQETSYVNHVIMNDNSGFMVLYDSIRDALLLKNGYIKHYWDESKTIREREYKGLTEIQLTQLFQQYEKEGAEVEVIEQEESSINIDGIDLPIFEIKVKITRKVNRLVLEAIPPEEMRIAKSCRGSLQTSPFTEHVTTKTRTDLIELGMDAEWVNSLPSYDSEDGDQEKIARNSVDDETDIQEGLSVDRSMDDIEYCEAYIRVDYDGDGKAELRRVVTCANRIPDGDEWNRVIDSVAITGLVSKRVPHRHIGESLHDDLSDLIRMKTFLYRQMYDNIYSTNNNERIINNRVHLPDFLQSIPGGNKRINDDLPVGDAVMYAPNQPIVDKILPAIDVLDRIKAGRTGISEVTTVQDPNVLRDSTKSAFETGLQQAGQKVEMIERMIAESGIKELVLRVHELLIKHQDIPRKIKIAGKYVDINPTQWRERTDLNIKVGLGTGTKDEHRQNLMIVSQLQEGLLKPLGLVTPLKAYNLFSEIARTLNVVNPDKYSVDPTPDENGQISPEYQQILQAQSQQPNPLAEAEQVKGMMQVEVDKIRGQFKLQSDIQKQQFDAILAEQKRQSDAQMELFKQQVAASEAQRDRESREYIEQMKMEIQSLLANKPVDLGAPGIGEK